jgi:hypothetical protein
MASMDGQLARYGQLHDCRRELGGHGGIYLHAAYEIRTKASLQTIVMRWVFSPRAFTDEDDDSLVVVVGNCKVRWCSSAFSGNSAELVRDGSFCGGKAMGLSCRGSPCCQKAAASCKFLGNRETVMGT